MRKEALKVCPTCRRHYGDDRVVCPNDGSAIIEIHGQAPEYGTMIDQRYVCFDIIGSGGMSHVFRAYDKIKHRPVALKVIKPRYAQRAAGVQRFFEEVRAVDRLHHPNIVEVAGFGQSAEGILYLAMDLLDGEDLESVIRTEKRLPPRMAVTIARQVAMALRSAHRAGVLHRDLKPENIILVGQRKVKLLDFGIATLLENGASQSEEAETVCGTPEYMSPEQIRGESCGPASDLYGLGVLLFEMLTGKAPFCGDTALEIVTKHLGSPAPDLQEHARENDGYDEIRSLVGALLSKKPEDRPAVEEVLHVLSKKVDLLDAISGSDTAVTALHDRPTLILSGSRETLLDGLSPGRETHLQSIPICRRCHLLNVNEGSCCEHCGDPLHALNNPTEEVALGEDMEPHPGEDLWRDNPVSTLRRKVSLLHVHLEPKAKNEPDWRQKIQRIVDAWSDTLETTEGVICHSSEHSIRIVFGLYATIEPAPVALREAERLHHTLLENAGDDASFSMALSTDCVFVEHVGLAAPDWALQGAKVDIATRMVRLAPPTTLLIDENTLSAVQHDIPHTSAGSILPRGADKREPLHVVHL